MFVEKRLKNRWRSGDLEMLEKLKIFEEKRLKKSWRSEDLELLGQPQGSQLLCRLTVTTSSKLATRLQTLIGRCS